MTVRIFAVAVETYQNTKITPVIFAENDANGFVTAWKNNEADVESIVLLSAQATRTTILSTFKKFLADVEDGDTVIFFYAGHGHRVGDTNYVTAHDTQIGDIASTSITLESFFSLLRNCNSKRILLFLDSCHSGMPTSDGMRSIISDFSPDELKAFCKDSEYHVGFASCKVNEASWPSRTLKHGIWTYHVIQALTGKASTALEKNCFVTGESLKNYLAIEVPLEVKKIRLGNEVQTPCVFGNSTKTFIIANVESLLVKARALNSELGVGLIKGYFRGQSYGVIARLNGFQKGRHRIPTRHSTTVDAFVQTIGGEEVSELATAIHDELKQVFRYKRRELVLVQDSGTATITTPSFNVNIDIAQDPKDEIRYRLRIAVSDFNPSEIVFEKNFQNVFSPHCDRLVIQFDGRVSVADRIDEIESNDALAEHLKYEGDNSSLTLDLPNPQLRLHMTSDELEISIPGTADIGLLLANYRQATMVLTNAGVKLISGKAAS